MNHPEVSGDPPVAAAGARALFSSSYRNQAMYLLKKEFPLLSVHVMSQIFKEHRYGFTRTFEALKTIRTALDTEGGIEQVRQQHACLQRVAKIRIQKARQKMERTRITNEHLLQELGNIPEFNRKESAATSSKKRPGTIVIDDNYDDERQNGIGLECACCFCECPIEDMVQCTEAHLFCLDCLSSYVNEQFHGKNTTVFRCMDSTGSEPCQGVFNRDQLQRLSGTFLEKFDKTVARKEVTEAGIDTCECPKCSYLGFVDNDVQNFNVLCEKCKCVFCKSCKETFDIHQDKTCEQVKQEENEDKKASAVNTTADAMTAAVIRHCPVCNLPCLKTEGCNRMTCPNTECPSGVPGRRTYFCYTCRQKIEGYDHFCGTPHCQHISCGKCILFTNSAEDDERARQEAGRTEVEKLNGTEEGTAAAGLLSTDKPREPSGFPGANTAPFQLPAPRDRPRRPNAHDQEDERAARREAEYATQGALFRVRRGAALRQEARRGEAPRAAEGRDCRAWFNDPIERHAQPQQTAAVDAQGGRPQDRARIGEEPVQPTAVEQRNPFQFPMPHHHPRAERHPTQRGGFHLLDPQQAPAPAQAQPQPVEWGPFHFGVPQPVPSAARGQPPPIQRGGFQFGVAQPAFPAARAQPPPIQRGGFQFGMAQPAPPAAVAQPWSVHRGGFQFGMPQPAPPAALAQPQPVNGGGFQFGGAQPAPPAPRAPPQPVERAGFQFGMPQPARLAPRGWPQPDRPAAYQQTAGFQIPLPQQAPAPQQARRRPRVEQNASEADQDTGSQEDGFGEVGAAFRDIMSFK